ncbi:hypothetical protein GALMADRAFT_152979 [Galerina marginata CBS 339.88]|uniref:Uncharacterized protein n=1 Tax=Galerina marginata (strain CBS 339.88) TaxID=685588 RepID=A0A067TGK4_GALM3|nr:hypothetical protein GALMADRAFT_152979 [Galerina marginata CBS 339.88]
MSVYTGKLNYAPYATNENVFFILPYGWVERGQAYVFSTTTKDGAGVEKDFTIRDLDHKDYYWYSGVRKDENHVTLSLKNTNLVNLSSIELTKLN